MQLVLEEVSKLYRGKVWGLRSFSLTLGPGVLGLLGPNGAGKSTLMRILATVTRATGGRVLWDGVDIARDPDALRAVLGYLPQDFGVYPHLSAMEFLEYIAAVKGLDCVRAPGAARAGSSRDFIRRSGTSVLSIACPGWTSPGLRAVLEPPSSG